MYAQVTLVNMSYRLYDSLYHVIYCSIYCNHIVFYIHLRPSGRTVMTQRQLDICQYRLDYDEFQRVQFSNNQVTCELTDRFSIVVKRQRHSVQIFLKSGERRLKLPFEVFEGLCHSQVSVTYLKHFLEEN